MEATAEQNGKREVLSPSRRDGRHGVTAFDSEGKAFDPAVHEAITMIDSDGGESGTVYAEERRGYLMNGELLRPARVSVLK